MDDLAVLDLIEVDSREKVKPGQPVYLTRAAVDGDYKRQGDVYITVCEKCPVNYEPFDKQKHGKLLLSTTNQLQLASGTTKGSRHVLDSTKGVKVMMPKDFTEDSLEGPWLQCDESAVITHPEHGAVHIEHGMSVIVEYQKNLDVVNRIERRARD